MPGNREQLFDWPHHWNVWLKSQHLGKNGIIGWEANGKSKFYCKTQENWHILAKIMKRHQSRFFSHFFAPAVLPASSTTLSESMYCWAMMSVSNLLSRRPSFMMGSSLRNWKAKEE